MATRYVDRPIPRISLRDFDQRIDEITAELVNAAENVGFFTLVDHGISVSEIENMFSTAQRFFSLPDDIKATVPWNANNFGENMTDLWMSDAHLPGFKDTSLAFMHRVQKVSERLMVCFARGLGFPDDFFIKCHDVSRPNEQTTMRLLHYYALPDQPDGKTYHRAGAHADWDFLTLLFQKEGQSGLEICPGREVVTEFGIGDEWTQVEAHTGDIVCNIGDLLMSWSDDRFKSTFHRVKAPSEPGDYFGDRYSIAYFNQPCKDALIQGPKKKYPLVTGEQFNANAMKRNFAALQEKLKLMEQAA
ncbi:Clavaminate synthase-like protein [Aspergillus vadensis CBS 113365]|uniref:Clavaminate synthase-like protein n=1 Tax=Aspergillus vadensis (strain CBS 113365 / IMI 142717 / IBT 24658) TaxID=1448311 RepID=A0A319BBT9_ASPVC|nr:Clavaminate synthase-like protein [Aspergillus vadensis CBS 113365]PYH70175.1 Clavaminate synthase-like protein [Aspergillus vadensis CBS 113365]